MKKTIQLNRRAFLKGAGATIYLPFLEAMLPKFAYAEIALPKRIVILYVPNGMYMPSWTPVNTGVNFTLSPTLQPLSNIKNKIMVLSGLNTKNKISGGGDHGWAGGTYLTQSDISNSTLKAGISVDQVIGNNIGSGTRARTINLGMEPTYNYDHDSWNFSAYISTLSWISSTQPFAKIIDPAQAFNTLFSGATSGTTDNTATKKLYYKKSILDAVLAQAIDLRVKLGVSDRIKLDEYLNSIRDIEQQIAALPQTPATCTVGAAPPSSNSTPSGAQYVQRVKIMLDLIVLACQCDATRVVTFQLAQEGSQIVYNNIIASGTNEGIKFGHHNISHYDGTLGQSGSIDQNKAWLAQINNYHVQQYAYLLGKMNAISDGTGMMLDNSIVMYGASMSDPLVHNHSNMPTVLAGGSNYITGNRHINYNGAPIANLYLWLLKTLGGTQSSFGPSTGVLPNIKV